MATMTIRLPGSKHKGLKKLAPGLSLNKLYEEWSTMALAEFDAECQFRIALQRLRLFSPKPHRDVASLRRDHCSAPAALCVHDHRLFFLSTYQRRQSTAAGRVGGIHHWSGPLRSSLHGRIDGHRSA